MTLDEFKKLNSEGKLNSLFTILTNHLSGQENVETRFDKIDKTLSEHTILLNKIITEDLKDIKTLLSSSSFGG
jgi:hypothetical protein